MSSCEYNDAKDDGGGGGDVEADDVRKLMDFNFPSTA